MAYTFTGPYNYLAFAGAVAFSARRHAALDAAMAPLLPPVAAVLPPLLTSRPDLPRRTLSAFYPCPRPAAYYGEGLTETERANMGMVRGTPVSLGHH